MFENPRRGSQARSFTTNVSKILDLKSSSEQIFFRKLSLGAPVISYDLVTTISPTQCFINRITYIFSSHQGSVNFKFGVVYAKQGQTTDDEVFSNG